MQLATRHRFVYVGEIGRYLDKSLVLEESRTALIALGVHLDKERQRWGGSVNPPLPPQR